MLRTASVADGRCYGLPVACGAQEWPFQRSATVSTSETWLTVMYLDPTEVQCRADEHETAVRWKLRALAGTAMRCRIHFRPFQR